MNMGVSVHEWDKLSREDLAKWISERVSTYEYVPFEAWAKVCSFNNRMSQVEKDSMNKAMDTLIKTYLKRRGGLRGI
jgi:hypothetical protein